MLKTRGPRCPHDHGAAAGQDVVLHAVHGEEASSLRLSARRSTRGDMNFPTYRQQGCSSPRDYPLVDMMCQVYSNERDPMKGRQLPVFYSATRAGFFSISGNLATQYHAGGRLGDGLGDQRATRASPPRGSATGSTAESRLPRRAGLRLDVPRARRSQRRQQSMGDLDSSGIAGGGEPTRSRPAALAIGIPRCGSMATTTSPCYARPRWAVERARRNLGPTLIE